MSWNKIDILEYNVNNKKMLVAIINDSHIKNEWTIIE